MNHSSNSSNHFIVAISGISGSGKSFIGSKLAVILNCIHIDEDAYYFNNKPQVQLSDGTIRSNWDTLEALDLVQLNTDLRNTNGIIILTGFALTDNIFDTDNKPNIHFHLEISDKLSLESRLATKGFELEDRAQQIMMFQEVVYPFYLYTAAHSSIDKVIRAELEDENDNANMSNISSHLRKPADQILGEIMDYVKACGGYDNK